MRYFAMILAALLMAGAAEAQVSVRRQSRGNNDGSGATAVTPAKPRRDNAAKGSDNERGKGNSDKGKTNTDKGKGNAERGNAAPTTTVKTAPKPAKKTSGSGAKDDKAVVQSNGKTLRQNNFDEYQKESQEETPWQHVVYREIDLTVEQNASLYYPVEPEDGLTNLFRVILDAFARGELKAYEYLGDRESFTERYEAKVMDILDKYEVPYSIETPKGSSKEIFVVDDVNVPSQSVLSYFVKERWEFDQKHSRFVPRILALCPVRHQPDEEGQSAKYPLFWVNFEDLRPFLRQHLIVSPGMNHAARFSMEEFFTLYKYEGTIYKEQNLRGLTLAQQYPNPDSLKMRQKEIDEKFRNFGKQIWVEDEVETEQPQEKKNAKQPKAEAKTDEKPVESRPVKTGRRDRRTKEEVVVDSAAVEAKATQRRSVRR